ncbi:MAG: DNA-binding protein [Mesorhizobium sp.]|nr:MAG: DNA-binding protein [Mesorhizobium sp.]
MKTTDNQPDLVWGCAAIARVIRRTQRQTFYMLENGTLPAKKVGGRWVSERGKLLAHLLEDAA